jgi:hypothetical protein
VSELPPSAPGANPGVQARITEAAALAARGLLSFERAARALERPSGAIHRKTPRPLVAVRLAGNRGRPPVDLADSETEIDASSAGLLGTRLPARQPRTARQLGILGC